MTLLLTRSEILELLDIPSILEVLRDGFTASTMVEPQRMRTDLPGPGTATALLPGVIPGIPAYTVKVNAKFPAATPALRGVVCLHDLADGSLLAVMDSSSVTAWRTGLAAALATDVLASAEAATVGVIGAGAQSAMVIRGLAALRPVRHLVVQDTDPRKAADFIDSHPTVPASIAVDALEVARRAELVVMATWSREPLLAAADVHPGQHFTSLGADEPGKVELSADLLLKARVVVDDRRLAVSMGAVGTVGLGEEAVHATLTEILTGRSPGRERSAQLTVYAPLGLPWQDLAVAWPVYQAALSAGTAGAIDFLA